MLEFDTLDYCLYLKYFGVLYGSYFEYSQCQNSLNMRSILGVYELCFDRLRTDSTISSRFLAENLHIRSHEWSKLLSWGAAGVLKVPAVFREYILRVYFGVRYCGCSLPGILQVFRESMLRILRYSQYLLINLQRCTRSWLGKAWC